MTSFPPRANPPVVGKVTHHSIELYWTSDFEAAEKSCPNGGRLHVCVQEQSDKDSSGWGNVYSGYAKSHIMDGLEPLTMYRYRIRYINDDGPGNFSAITTVSTVKEPLTGEHLHKLVQFNDRYGVENVLETGEINIDVKDKFGYTPLMQAAQKGFIEVIDTLLDNGADVNMSNEAGKTALMLAAFSGQVGVVESLLARNAKIAAADRGGSQAIHWAIDGGHLDVIRYLLYQGANVNAADHHAGWTPLIRCSTMHGRVSVAEILLKAGANVNAKDRNGRTSLIAAVINGHDELIRVLLAAGADLNVRNESGATVMDIARSMGNRRVQQVLDEWIEKNPPIQRASTITKNGTVAGV